MTLAARYRRFRARSVTPTVLLLSFALWALVVWSLVNAATAP